MAPQNALIDGLHARIERDPALRPLFGRDLTNERAAQRRFLPEWLGGEPAYTEHAWAPLAHRHGVPLPAGESLLAAVEAPLPIATTM